MSGNDPVKGICCLIHFMEQVKPDNIEMSLSSSALSVFRIFFPMIIPIALIGINAGRLSTEKPFLFITFLFWDLESL